jgi:pimeloyl-ACP methyl ester carboxylesterase
MEEVMGPLPWRLSGPPALQILSEARAPAGYLRRKILYEAEIGDWVPAWLLIPATGRARPSAVCLHQTTRFGKDEPAGLNGLPNLHYADELARRGYTCIVPDYPNFGEYSVDPYTRGYVSATMKGIVNHIRAVDLLASLDSAARASIAAIGHSLGGHNALFLAAFDDRVTAVVTSCGFTSMRRYYGGNLTGWSHGGYMPRIATAYGKSAARMPFDFPDVLEAIAPRSLFVNAPLRDANFDVAGVRECLDVAAKFYPPEQRSRLAAVHPDCLHDFPLEVREQSYAFLDRALEGQ